MDLSGSARTPTFPCISAIFECHTILRVDTSKRVRAPFARTYHQELERAWQFEHMIITIPAELWGLITHMLVYLWELLLAGGMTEKEIISLRYLSTFAWIFPTISAVHFLAFAFLAITFWSKECVITGIEGLMSSGSVQDLWQCDWHSVLLFLVPCFH